MSLNYTVATMDVAKIHGTAMTWLIATHTMLVRKTFEIFVSTDIYNIYKVLSGSIGYNPVYKISRCDPDSALDHMH